MTYDVQQAEQVIGQRTIEDQLQKAIYTGNLERTNFDKVLSKHEMFRLREIMSKESLTIIDISEIQNILVSTEAKLTNFDDWDRYVIGKYFIWVCEYAKRYSKALRAKVFYAKIWDSLNDRTKELRAEIEKEYTETYKLLVHVYCYLIRTPLSVEGALVDRLTIDRKEIEYTGNTQVPAQVPQQQWRMN